MVEHLLIWTVINSRIFIPTLFLRAHSPWQWVNNCFTRNAEWIWRPQFDTAHPAPKRLYPQLKVLGQGYDDIGGGMAKEQPLPV